MLRQTLLALLGLIALATPGTAQTVYPAMAASSFGSDLDGVAVWRSTTGNPDKVALEVAQLLLTLDRAGALPIETIVDPLGRTMEEIMRDESRFVGAYFPLALDSYLCSMNDHVCEVAGPDLPGKWTNVAGDILTVPALTFTEFLAFGSQQKPAGTPLLELVGLSENGCASFGTSCAEAVEQLNVHNPAAFDDAAVAKVIVPQTGYRTEFDWDRLDLSPGNVVVAADRDDETWSLIKTLVEPKIVAVGEGLPQSSYSGEPAYEDQREMFALIGFPFSDVDDAADIPTEFQDPIRVAVVDTWLDNEHCELGDNISILPPFVDSALPSAPPQPGSCGERADIASEVWDHATHIVGLIAARLDGKGIGGLNPFAHMSFRQVDLQSLASATYRQELGIALVRDRVTDRAEIFNLSWRYFNERGGLDTLETTLTETLASALVVVAAGNDGSTFRLGNCVALPACFAQSPNVITVVGIDRQVEQPGLWRSGAQGSNSSREFHVGAIAADVVSTVSRDRYGAMSGTSQAAPQVTATAAYLISAYRHHFGNAPLAPVRIKNRIIYTSDIFPRLLESSLGGRLNMRRAMAIGRDHLIVRSEAGTTAFDGRLTLIGDDPAKQFVLCRDAETRGEVYIYKEDLYRFVQSDLGRYVVFARSVRNDPESAIRRIDNCELLSRSQQVEFITNSGDRKTFRLDQIRDFVAAME